METALIIELFRAVWRELIYWRTWVFSVFLLVSFLILAVGIKWEEQYETSAVIYADTSNIIQPLLQGSAELTTIDRLKEAGKLIYTRKILAKAAASSGLLTSDDGPDKQETIIKTLRSKIRLKSENSNQFRILYLDVDQDRSFNVLNAVVDAFIKDSSSSRREESRAAFDFIDQQVVAYKRQLLVAEAKLKEFQSKNTDGSLESVTNRINQLRLNIEDHKLVISETEVKKKTLDEQLRQESKNLVAASKADAQRKKLDTLQAQLDSLRLSYQETYPDIVVLKEQIEAQQLVVEAMQSGGYIASSSSKDGPKNPLYAQLRNRQAQAETDLLSQRRRLESMKRMLEEEYARAERVASRQADLSELNRDYGVTKGIYEEMLGRKEKARLSMTLDIEGQGVNFKIQDPAVFPLKPSGIKFIHFAIAAPFVGFLLALGLVIAYVLLDMRVRSPILLASKLPPEVELLAVIPHVNTPLGVRLLRADMMLLGLALLVSLSVYVVIVYSHLRGFI